MTERTETNGAPQDAKRPAMSDLLTVSMLGAPPDNLVDRVRQALKNAKENGYDMVGLTTREVTEDLLEYDADIEGENFSNVYASVHFVRMNG